MKDWLSKYWIALCGLFVACLGLYLNLQNWSPTSRLISKAVSNLFERGQECGVRLGSTVRGHKQETI